MTNAKQDSNNKEPSDKKEKRNLVEDGKQGIDSNPFSNSEISHIMEKQKKNSFFHLVLTSMAAAVGVQSSKNLAQDFSQKSPLPFIVAGILFTVLFLGTIILVVKYVLRGV